MGHCSCCAHTHECAPEKHIEKKESIFAEYWKVGLSFILLISGIIMNALELPFFREGYFSLIWYVVAYLPVGLPVMKEAWESMKDKDYFSEFTLMFVATLGAFYIGEYPEGVAVMLFYSVGELFQEKAVDKAKRNIGALLDVRPEEAAVVRDGRVVIENPQNVKVGETIEIKTGGRVPLDGMMLNEVAAFNTAALTGESVPRSIRMGEEVLAGMIVTDKVIRIKVIRPFDKSALARILELVQNASERKAPAELFIRKFARVYTPIVIGLAVLIVLLPFIYSLITPQFLFTFNDWLYRALVFLVISCPCALVVSIPLGYFGGIGAASRLGILFKGGNYLDAVTKINTVVFDKTGTLTKGTFEVQSCNCESGVSEEELIRMIASVESSSTHPIAKAVVNYAGRRDIELSSVTDSKEYAGLGLEAAVNGIQVLAGNGRLLSKFQIEYPPELLSITDTIVVCAIGNKYAGYLLLSDSLKEDAKIVIQNLKALGIQNIQILSGDKQSIVSNFAEKLGISEAYGDLLPDGKVKHLEELRQHTENQVAFVGDGMNDAPVLALSNVGIAMGGLGSDAAIETADVVIQTDQSSKVAEAIKVGKLTRRIVWQNISLAFGVKLLVLILGAGGLATLWEAVFADVGVALIAIMNAVRIQKMIK
ncbi:heavy metal translocating P-type ATPase [Bacteroides thetaiotaomicron]|uniref:heavy metal translocating P-type ATPase n=2 Tax=Bacteroides thetaiotaomicron TaxID=818 RepID=UPI00232E24A1|nr:heavy metal translocating P-type ATPase [Bacteroides thetaiotaomicron]MDC2008729.1 heavy metal translocating P-type ATPase [Bacteroides thetaiotaomicron]MDC2023069.1 heavy metal translocating P-type ATPase [Bacteroides thetaiotaomicron]MDC2025971.1 heavy metal translocating P-type ATPase [Bacteroides thetaiotaomicron]MDC2032176.1 heavy metal translocating P-type ATPase [Bacteroides thetaiotaomicron]MDC2063015.1 heavy metal translocating P-type ATPase [Bacteroides thetaiotaomicron]